MILFNFLYYYIISPRPAPLGRDGDTEEFHIIY